MRFVLVLATGLCLAGVASVEAATLRPAGVAADPLSSNIIEVAGPNCGPHAHYVRGHRSTKDHHFIKGRCIRNHH
jgi:hypothetical protein